MSIKDCMIRKGMGKEQVNEIIGEYISLVDDVYLGNEYIHDWICKCGHIIECRRWNTIKSDNAVKCSTCKQNEIEQRYKYEVERNGEYEYIRSYRMGDILSNGKVVANNPYIQVKHKYCGNIYEVIANNFINKKQRCSNCCGVYENSFAHYIEVELGEPLEKYWDFDKNILNPYYISKASNKNKVWLKCIHKNYHESYDVTCNNFLSGNQRCPYCSRNKVHPLDSFGQYLKDNSLLHLWSDKNTINPFTIARSSGNKVWMLCDKHDYHNDYGGYAVRCLDFVKNKCRCSYCYNRKVHHKDSFGYLHPDKAKYWHEDNDKSPYEIPPGSGKKFKFRCDECGHVWNTRVADVVDGKWCPHCKSSKGEKKISEWLIKNNIKYQSQYRFKKCRNKRELPFDFYLSDYEIAIEYDGEQHFKPIDIFDGENGLEGTRIRDKIKNKYCEDNNIELIRIPYWNFKNIEEILNETLTNK